MIDTLNRAAIGWLVALSGACGSEDAQQQLELTGIVIDAQSTTVEPIDRLTLSVATTIEAEFFQIPLDSLSTTVDLPSGALTLEVLAERQNADGSFSAVYFGDASIYIAPGASAQLTIPIFPAGRLDVEILLNPEDTPTRAVVTFEALNPRAEQTEVFVADFNMGRIARVLPSGDYIYQAQASFDAGREFEAVSDESDPVRIEQGAVLAETLDLR